MARKPVLTGGKRDEIINSAMRLFFEKGYEATSVRKIMEEAGGEIGMFYHYFKSKEELFDRVVERFFKEYQKHLKDVLSSCNSPKDFADLFLPLYEDSMKQFDRLKENMHWTIQYAMNATSIRSFLPTVITLLDTWEFETDCSADILAGQLIYGISATIHTESFRAMDDKAKKICLESFIGKILGG